MRILVLSAVLLISIRHSSVYGQNLSPALGEYLVSHENAIVSIHTTKTLPNGLTSPVLGTGFVISSDGLILTAAHVVDGIARDTLGVSHASATLMSAQFRYQGSLAATGNSLHELKLVTLDDLRDMALLKFEEVHDYPHFELASGSGLRPPDQIVALGFPSGSEAVIPAIGRITDTSRQDGRWLIDAPVNPGHSGGPIIRRDGKVVGLVHAGIQGVTLMNLMLPLGKSDAILRNTQVVQDLQQWPPDSDNGLPKRDRFDDIMPTGSCAERAPMFEDPEKSLHWICAEITVPNGVTEQIEKTRTARVVIPASAALVDVRYFHRSRGDWRNPVEEGPWTTTPPDVDLQWMMIEKAEVLRTGDDQVIQAQCRNWSHNLKMFCAIGVCYRTGAWLW